MLCHKCVFKLEEYCEFRQLCLSTDKFFRSKLPWPDDSSQQGTLLQENELTNTKSTSSFKGASCDGIVLNADYVNSRLGKSVATPLITDSSLLSQNNPVDSTIYLSNVSSTDKFILEVDDDEGRTKIDVETQKSAQAITSVEDSLPIYSTNKGFSQQVKRKQDKQGNVDNQKKNLVSAREQVMVAPTRPQRTAIFASSFRQVCRKNAHQMHLSQPGRNIDYTATPLDKVVRSASDQKSLNPALPLSYVNPDESNPRLDLVSNAGTQPMDKCKESSGVNVGACLIYTCETCERTFVSSESANAHRCGDDNSSLSGEEVESQKDSSQQSFESETGNYLCNYCSKVFTRYVSLISHQEAHLQDLDDPSLESDDDDDDYVANRIVTSFHSGREQCARAGMFVDKTSHTETEKRGTFAFVTEQQNMLLNLTNVRDNVWTMEIGELAHMTHMREFLWELQESSDGNEVVLGSNQSLSIKGMGTVKIRKIISGKCRSLYLSSALAQAAPPTPSTTWTASQSMLSKPCGSLGGHYRSRFIALLFKLFSLNSPFYLVKVVQSYLSHRTFSTTFGNATSQSQKHPGWRAAGFHRGPGAFQSVCERHFKIPRHQVGTVCGRHSSSSGVVARTAGEEATPDAPDAVEGVADHLKDNSTGWPHFACSENRSDGRTVLSTWDLTLDTKLTWRRHCNERLKKAKQRLGILGPLLNSRSALSARNGLTLYKQLPRPILDYTCPAWGHLADTYMRRMQAFQSVCLGIIVGAPGYVRNERLHRYLDMPTIKDHFRRLSQSFYDILPGATNPLIQGLGNCIYPGGCHRRPKALLG
uniref:(California timema) hypothetical protein n=1 Tax=Timema californicum TaxID=61474 RepID=A0A7R9P5D4_TIMCA|nr:unnamed protein product [Timema californicum]